MKRGALTLIGWYQAFVSPILPPACRFEPTCSHYGAAAVRRYGVLKGGALTLWRLARCNPFNRGGYDPVR